MEPYKLLLLAKKLHPGLRTRKPSTLCRLFLTDVHYQPINRLLSAKEMIVLSLLINGLNRNENITQLYEQILGNMFIFSTAEVEDENPEEGCTFCAGDGQITCRECNGSGNVDCEECDGEGQIYDSDEDGGGTCQVCDGGGEMTCDECEGTGYEICFNCEGSGSVVMDGFMNVTQDFYVSYDSKIYSLLETKHEGDEMKPELDHIISKSSRTFVFNSHNGETNKMSEEVSNGDRIFVGLEKGDIQFIKTYGSIVGNSDIEEYILK